MGHLIAKWYGETWTAMLTQERYGQHLSICGWDPRYEMKGATQRLATDDECDAARAYGHAIREHLEEVTGALLALGWKVNPHVRQFVPDEEAGRLFSRAAEKLT